MTFIGSAKPGSYYQAGASTLWQGRLPLSGLSGYFSSLVRHISTGRIVEEETSRRQSHRAGYSQDRCRSSCLLEVSKANIIWLWLNYITKSIYSQYQNQYILGKSRNKNVIVDGPGLRFYWYIPSTGQNRSKMVQYTKIDANRCVLKPFWGVLKAFWGKNEVFWGDFGVGRRGFWIEKWDERGDGRWDSGEKSWWAGGFLDSFYLCKISPMPLPPIFSIFGGFSSLFVVPCLPPCLALSILLVATFGGACLAMPLRFQLFPIIHSVSIIL